MPSDSTRESPGRDIAILFVWALSLGLIVAAISVNLRFATRLDTLHNLGAVLQGEPFKTGDVFRADLPFYNRILFPLAHRLMSRWLPFASEGQWYLLLRIASFQMAFLVFGLTCRRGIGTSRLTAGLAMALLGIATVTSFNFPWEETSDALDMVVTAAGVWAALRRRFLVCLALSILFAANRESAAFLGLIWFVLMAKRDRWRRPAIEGGVICVLSYGTALALKIALGPVLRPNWAVARNNLDRLTEALADFKPLGWLPMLVATLVMLLLFADTRLPQVQRFLLLAATFIVLNIWFGLVNELRIFLPTFIMLCFAAAESVRSR